MIEPQKKKCVQYPIHIVAKATRSHEDMRARPPKSPTPRAPHLNDTMMMMTTLVRCLKRMRARVRLLRDCSRN